MLHYIATRWPIFVLSNLPVYYTGFTTFWIIFIPNKVSGYMRTYMHKILHEATLILAWISNHMSSKMSYEFTYPFSNFNSPAIQVWIRPRRWSFGMDNFIAHLTRHVITCSCCIQVNPCWHTSSPARAPYMRQWIGSALVQIMDCRLFGARSLSKQCWVIVNHTISNKIQRNFNQGRNFSFTKMHLKLSSAKWRPFCPGGMS